MGSDDWVYAGSSLILSDSYLTIVPDSLLNDGGFDSKPELVWAYDRESGAVIAAVDIIHDDRIVSVDSRFVFGEKNINRVRIPYQMIDDLEDTARSDHPELVPDDVRFEPNDRLHWIYDPSAYDWEIKWWYVLTDEELGNGSDSGEQSVRSLK